MPTGLLITKGLNIADKTAQKLTQKSITFDSPTVPGLQMINTKYYNNQGSRMNPNIESFIFRDDSGVSTEFSSKRFQNGSRFEIYKLPDEIIKIFKNKFGEIKGFKSSIKEHNKQPELIYENVKNAMQDKTHNFLA